MESLIEVGGGIVTAAVLGVFLLIGLLTWRLLALWAYEARAPGGGEA